MYVYIYICIYIYIYVAYTSAFGKLVGAVGCVFGVVVLAMPTTVLGLEFSKAYDEYKENQKGSKQARLLLKGLRSVSQV